MKRPENYRPRGLACASFRPQRSLTYSACQMSGPDLIENQKIRVEGKNTSPATQLLSLHTASAELLCRTSSDKRADQFLSLLLYPISFSIHPSPTGHNNKKKKPNLVKMITRSPKRRQLNLFLINPNNLGAGNMARPLRVLTVLVTVPDWVPTTQVWP